MFRYEAFKEHRVHERRSLVSSCPQGHAQDLLGETGNESEMFEAQGTHAKFPTVGLYTFLQRAKELSEKVVA